MTDFHTPAARRLAEDAERAARHEVLIDLLGAYADGELPPETVSQIDAHLIACARCRREVTVHRVMRARLAAEPLTAASPALRDRIVGAIGALPAPAVTAATTARAMLEATRDAAAIEPAPAPMVSATSALRPWGGVRRVVVAVVAATAAAVVALFALNTWREGARTDADPAPPTAAVTRWAAPASAVPLLSDVLTDYRRTVRADLPGRARDLAAVRAAVPFPVEPLMAPELHILAAWATLVGGEPTAVIAYRWNEQLVLQYFVPEQAFFRHSAVRLAVAARHHVAAVDGAQGVVAWAEPAAGSILVADIVPEQLGRFRAPR